MKKLLFVLLLIPGLALAKQQEFTWTWPTQDCDADAIAVADIVSSTLIIDTSPMPMPSDTAGPCSGSDDPGAPVTAIEVPISVPDTSVFVNLQPGVTYYARINVCTFTATNCSVWSTQTQFIVAYGKPRPVELN